MTRLEAINEVLTRCGLHPVSALETGTNSTVATIERILDMEILRVCTEVYHFNTEKMTLTPDVSTSKVALPTGTIEIDLLDSDERDVTARGDYLYDLTNSTLEFEGDVEVIVSRLFDWGCIPEPIRQYIAASTASRFNEGYGAGQRQPLLDRAKEKARLVAQQFNTRVADVNLLDTHDAYYSRGFRTRMPGSGLF
jgi:hypothetical protein